VKIEARGCQQQTFEIKRYTVRRTLIFEMSYAVLCRFGVPVRLWGQTFANYVAEVLVITASKHFVRVFMDFDRISASSGDLIWHPFEEQIGVAFEVVLGSILDEFWTGPAAGADPL